MSDPAVEAAQRAWDALIELHRDNRAPGPNENPWLTAKIAAREALKPMRATYTRWEAIFAGQRGDVPEMVQVLLKELAPLIFTTEELA